MIYIVEDLKHIKKGVDLMSRTDDPKMRELLNTLLSRNLEILSSRFSREKKASRGRPRKGETK